MVRILASRSHGSQFSDVLTDKNVAAVMCLADRFDMPRVTRACEEFVCGAKCKFSVERKLELSGTYNSVAIQEVSFHHMNTSF